MADRPVENAILCNLSLLRQDNYLRALSNPDSQRYFYVDDPHDDEHVLTGIQTNEAPVKYLLRKAHEEGVEVSYIYCLCTKETTLEEGVDKARYGLVLKDESEPVDSTAAGTKTSEPISTFDFFADRIFDYCKNDLNMELPPTIETIVYDMAHPANCLGDLISVLNSRFKLDIDITGGTRESTILTMLALQVIKARYDNADEALDDIVYSDYSTHDIRPQTKTFRIMDLITAVGAFTNYGRADRLDEFFSTGEGRYSSEIISLIRAMKDFSNVLALCQVEEIDNKINAVYECLDKEEAYVAKGMEDYCPTGEYATIPRDELLFASLIPSIRHEFVPQCVEVGNRYGWVPGTVRWCAEHQMSQQALCIYREHISGYLAEAGVIAIDQRAVMANRLYEKTSREQRARLDTMLYTDFSENGYIIGQFEQREGPYYSVADPGRARCAFTWAKYLHYVRNAVMHSDMGVEETAKFQRAFAAAKACYPEKVQDDWSSFEAVTGAILSAIDDLVECRTIGDSAWSSMYESLPVECRSQEQPNVPSAESGQSTQVTGCFHPNPDDPSDWDWACRLLMHYDSSRAVWGLPININEEVNGNEFILESHAPITKKTLGLRGNQSVVDALVSRFPQEFAKYRAVQRSGTPLTLIRVKR